MRADEWFERVLDEMSAMRARKGADYGTDADTFANVRASEAFGIPAWVGSVLRANDKMTRIQSFVVNGSLKNESIEDALIDMAMYAAIGLCLYREANAKS